MLYDCPFLMLTDFFFQIHFPILQTPDWPMPWINLSHHYGKIFCAFMFNPETLYYIKHLEKHVFA